MVDDPFARENVVAVSFSEHSNAYEALNRLKELDGTDEVSVRGAAVVIRGEDGKVVTKEQIGDESWTGTASGGLIGLLIGVLGGPLGIIVGGASGVLVGSLFDEDDMDETESALADISKSVRVGTPALLADVIEENPVAIDAAMANLGGTVLRRSAGDVQAEVAAAEEAQREAKKKARKELRDARHKKHKEEIDAKVADLKAKLDRQKKPAATS
ncbi:MAG TPA: DUF1269 domain-containing protein [Solirubrobacteraceae bacterium]|nr:DUF1269 domain-containing protein [Solirubrobacteraceae bacterium]